MQIYRRVVPNQKKKNRGEHIQTHLSAAVSSLEIPTVAVVGTLVHLGDFPQKRWNFQVPSPLVCAPLLQALNCDDMQCS